MFSVYIHKINTGSFILNSLNPLFLFLSSSLCNQRSTELWIVDGKRMKCINLKTWKNLIFPFLNFIPTTKNQQGTTQNHEGNAEEEEENPQKVL